MRLRSQAVAARWGNAERSFGRFTVLGNHKQEFREEGAGALVKQLQLLTETPEGLHPWN